MCAKYSRQYAQLRTRLENCWIHPTTAPLVPLCSRKGKYLLSKKKVLDGFGILRIARCSFHNRETPQHHVSAPFHLLSQSTESAPHISSPQNSVSHVHQPTDRGEKRIQIKRNLLYNEFQAARPVRQNQDCGFQDHKREVRNFNSLLLTSLI